MVINLYDYKKSDEVNNLKDFFKPGGLYTLIQHIPIYKNKNCFEKKMWSWINCEESNFFDLDYSIDNASYIFGLENKLKNNVFSVQSKKMMLFIDFVRNNENVTGTGDDLFVFYYPITTFNKILKSSFCLKFLYQFQVIYVPITFGLSDISFKKQENYYAKF